LAIIAPEERNYRKSHWNSQILGQLAGFVADAPNDKLPLAQPKADLILVRLSTTTQCFSGIVAAHSSTYESLIAAMCQVS